MLSVFRDLLTCDISETNTVHPQIKTYVPFLDKWAIASEWSFAFVSGVLPPVVSGIFGFFLPIIMRWLSQVCVSISILTSCHELCYAV